jgi:hypothetical protein
MASKFEAFLAANPTNPRVVRITKLADGPLRLNSKLGKLVGELMREEGL